MDITAIGSVAESLLLRLREHTKEIGVTGIYDYVPEAEKLPYIALGEIKSVNDGTKVRNGERFTFDINLYSKNKGRKKDIDSIVAVQKALNKSPLFPTENAIPFESVDLDTHNLVSAEIDKGLFLTILTLDIRIEKEEIW